MAKIDKKQVVVKIVSEAIRLHEQLKKDWEWEGERSPTKEVERSITN